MRTIYDLLAADGHERHQLPITTSSLIGVEGMELPEVAIAEAARCD